MLRNLPDRFLDKIQFEPNSGCWLWIGALTKSGYGAFKYKGKQVSSHRFSFESLRSTIHDGMHLDHLCRVRCCVNPDHLEPVKPIQNVARSPIHNGQKQFCPKGHPYQGNNLYVSPKGFRGCRICRSSSVKMFSEKEKQNE